MNDFDILVVGGGLIGGAVALDLGRRGWRVGVLDPREPAAVAADSPYQLRVTAINRRSQAYLEGLGVWDDVAAIRACRFTRLGVWESGRLRDGVLFSAEELGTTHLGHFVENDVLQRALWHGHDAVADITRFAPATPQAIELRDELADETGEERHRIHLDDGSVLTAPLLVAAEGAESELRRRAGIPVDRGEYGQHAVAASVRLAGDSEWATPEITWQQFTPEGPRAYLPLGPNHASLILYTHGDRARSLLDRSPQAFRDALEHAFPEELGGIEEVGASGSFRIQHLHARTYTRAGVVLVGDAAHVVHPLAGQGANLGFRDAEVLGECLGDAGAAPFVNPSALARYSRQRRADNQLMLSAMTAFHQGFRVPGSFARNVRGVGLQAARFAGPARRAVMAYATWGTLPAGALLGGCTACASTRDAAEP